MKFRKIVDHLTGFSTPIFGVSWNPPKSERDTVRKLITFLEDRRVLYNPYQLEDYNYVVKSIIETRCQLTKILSELDDDSKASSHLRAMRSACRQFLDVTHPFAKQKMFIPFEIMRCPEILTAFGEFRTIFGIHIAQLSVEYGIDIEKSLESILPPRDTK